MDRFCCFFFCLSSGRTSGIASGSSGRTARKLSLGPSRERAELSGASRVGMTRLEAARGLSPRGLLGERRVPGRDGLARGFERGVHALRLDHACESVLGQRG